MAYWTDEGAPCDVCGEWTRRRCNCGQALCVDCGRQFAGSEPPMPHRDMMLGVCERPPTRYLSQAAIGRALGVSRHAVLKMRARHKNFPEPDAWVISDKDEPSTVTSAPLWLPERLPEIVAWRESLPGRGARPPRAAPG